LAAVFIRGMSHHKKPIIGITLSLFRSISGEKGRPPAWVAYADVVAQNGGLPLFIPTHLDPDQSAEIYDGIDGLLLSGGGDILPEHYGQERTAELDEPDPKRDVFEFVALKQAMRRGMPFIGICRGLQVINVALGGSLFQDIRSERPGSLQHAGPDSRPEPWHSVHLHSDTKLHTIIAQGEFEANSYHHQAIRDLAPGLTVCAQSPDEIIEAIELPGFPFGLAVQWHPERMPQAPSTKALLGALMRAAEHA
jgi:putative glutamine amidotransferase